MSIPALELVNFTKHTSTCAVVEGSPTDEDCTCGLKDAAEENAQLCKAAADVYEAFPNDDARGEEAMHLIGEILQYD